MRLVVRSTLFLVSAYVILGIEDNAMKHLTHYQDQGFVPVDERNIYKSLARANEQLAECRNATPKALRAKYRSIIRWAGDGYSWYWILR